MCSSCYKEPPDDQVRRQPARAVIRGERVQRCYPAERSVIVEAAPALKREPILPKIASSGMGRWEGWFAKYRPSRILLQLPGRRLLTRASHLFTSPVAAACYVNPFPSQGNAITPQ